MKYSTHFSTEFRYFPILVLYILLLYIVLAIAFVVLFGKRKYCRSVPRRRKVHISCCQSFCDCLQSNLYWACCGWAVMISRSFKALLARPKLSFDAIYNSHYGIFGTMALTIIRNTSLFYFFYFNVYDVIASNPFTFFLHFSSWVNLLVTAYYFLTSILTVIGLHQMMFYHDFNRHDDSHKHSANNNDNEHEEQKSARDQEDEREDEEQGESTGRQREATAAGHYEVDFHHNSMTEMNPVAGGHHHHHYHHNNHYFHHKNHLSHHIQIIPWSRTIYRLGMFTVFLYEISLGNSLFITIVTYLYLSPSSTNSNFNNINHHLLPSITFFLEFVLNTLPCRLSHYGIFILTLPIAYLIVSWILMLLEKIDNDEPYGELLTTNTSHCFVVYSLLVLIHLLCYVVYAFCTKIRDDYIFRMSYDRLLSREENDEEESDEDEEESSDSEEEEGSNNNRINNHNNNNMSFVSRQGGEEQGGEAGAVGEVEGRRNLTSNNLDYRDDELSDDGKEQEQEITAVDRFSFSLQQQQQQQPSSEQHQLSRPMSTVTISSNRNSTSNSNHNSHLLPPNSGSCGGSSPRASLHHQSSSQQQQQENLDRYAYLMDDSFFQQGLDDIELGGPSVKNNTAANRNSTTVDGSRPAVIISSRRKLGIHTNSNNSNNNDNSPKNSPKNSSRNSHNGTVARPPGSGSSSPRAPPAGAATPTSRTTTTTTTDSSTLGGEVEVVIHQALSFGNSNHSHSRSMDDPQREYPYGIR